MKKLTDIILLATAILVLVISYDSSCSNNEYKSCNTTDKLIVLENEPTEKNSDGSVLNYFVLIVSLLITFLCLFIILFMLVSRYITIGKTASLVPEEWGKLLNQNNNNVINSLESLISNIKQNNLNFDNTSKNVSKIFEILLGYQKVLQEKDLIIKRYQEGYDTKLIKNFISKFLFRHKKLKKIIANKDYDSETIENYSSYLFSAIEECGVQEINIKIGSDFRDLGNKVSDSPTIISSSNKDLDFKIKEVIEKGYFIGDEEPTIIIPTKVAIYKFNEKEESK